MNEIIDRVGQIFNITLNNHCSYHPQTAGLVDRANGTIKSRLRRCMDETGKSWIYCLDLVKLWQHIAPHATKGLSPFEMMYGRPYVLPTSQQKPGDDEVERTLADYMRRVSAAIKRCS